MRTASSSARCDFHQMGLAMSILWLELLLWVLGLRLLRWRRLVYKLRFIAISVGIRRLSLTLLAEVILRLGKLLFWRRSVRLYRSCLGGISNIRVDLRILVRGRVRILSRNWLSRIRCGSSAVMRRGVRTRRSMSVGNLLLGRKTRVLRHWEGWRSRPRKVPIRRGRREASRHSRGNSSLR